MPDTVANKKWLFTTKHIVVILITSLSSVTSLISILFVGYLEYKILHMQFNELQEDFEYQIERQDRKYDRFDERLKKLENE